MWYHYTDKPFQEAQREYNKDGCKPDGLWLSYNDEWLKYCIEEGFHTDDDSYCYEVTLDGNFITIETVQQYIEFNTKYKPRYMGWSKVKAEYDGIKILNYKDIKGNIPLIPDNTWFYGLDVSCACVWRGFKVLYSTC